MTKKPTASSPLRQRMIEDMVARNLVAGTQRGHIAACKLFAAYLGRSPETATPDDVRNFQRHLIDSGKSIHNRNRIMTGVKFLLKVTMRRHDLVAEVYHLREPQKIATVLAPDEVERIIEHAPCLKARAMLSIGYGCGLRGGEVTRLRVRDIDKEQHVIRIEQSKGRKDRNVMLPDDLVGLLRRWWKERDNRHDRGVAPGDRWLFPGYRKDKPISPRQFHRYVKEAAAAASITKRVMLHTLRHSCATHLHDNGVDIRDIQALLGHSSLATTARYTRIATGRIARIESPLDRLGKNRREKPRPKERRARSKS
jgi:integrase/recombinase XerD